MKSALNLINLTRIGPPYNHLGNQAFQVSSLFQLPQHFLNQGGILVEKVDNIQAFLNGLLLL